MFDRRFQLGSAESRLSKSNHYSQETRILTYTPQNSSTESKVTTSLRSSFQLSLCMVVRCQLIIKHQFEEPSIKLRTLPLDGFVNHRVQVCIRGCLTLKLSASWKTVICSSSPCSLLPALEDSSPSAASPLASRSPPPLPSAGEMGMVSSGTGESGFGVPLAAAGGSRFVAIVAMIPKFDEDDGSGSQQYG